MPERTSADSASPAHAAPSPPAPLAPPTFGDELRRARLARGWTQAELAERAGLSIRGINDLERGARATPRRYTLTVLADALGLEGSERAAFTLAAHGARARVTPRSVPPTAGAALTAESPHQPAPPLDTIPAPRAHERRPPHNLSVQPTALLGREREMAEITRLLRVDDAWLVTLTGPPGVGKTRLSLQVATELADAADLFPDGVWFVRLSRLSDPALVMPAIAHELGLREGGAKLIAQMLRDYLSDKRLLLVIDNFEHLSAAASDLADLLHQCPGVRALVTSRASLRLRGERQYALAALPIPPMTLRSPVAPGAAPHAPELLALYASVALFTERAQATLADFALTPATAPAVAAICARLDGLPLALELAAARVKLLPPDALLARLERTLTLLSDGSRDLDERQWTMRATLAWSEALLSPDERALFRRLAVFAGGATIAMVEMVCLAPEGAAPLAIDALPGLAALLDQSLIQRREERGELRFGMLHVVREYALERLEVSGEAEALRQAHALAFLRLAEEPGPLAGTGDGAWLAHMAAEQDNLRVALTWTFEQELVEWGLGLGIGAAQLWYVRGNLREGRRWLDRLLQLAHVRKDASPTYGRWRRWAMEWTAIFAFNQAEFDVAESMWQWEYEKNIEAGDDALLAMSLTGRAIMIVRTPGTEELATSMLAEALAIARRSGDEAVLTHLLTEIGSAMLAIPENEQEALALTEEGLVLARRRGDRHAEVEAHYVVLYISMWTYNVDAARAAALRALGIAIAEDYDLLTAHLVYWLVPMAACAGRSERAARLEGAARMLFQRTGQGSISGYADVKHIGKLTAPAHAALGAERWAAEVALGRAMTPEEAIAEALREARDEPA